MKNVEERNRLVEENMKLVPYMIRKMYPYCSDWNRYEDLYSEGYLALIKAADMFDPSFGVKFSTYACKAIFRYANRQKMRTEYVVHVPFYKAEEIGKDERWEEFQTLSLDARNAELKTLMSSLSDERVDVEGEVLSKICLEQAMKSLQPRQQFIVEERMIGKTFEEIADQFGITRSRVQQIHTKSRKKMEAAFA